jgi:hypothetical protein
MGGGAIGNEAGELYRRSTANGRRETGPKRIPYLTLVADNHQSDPADQRNRAEDGR